MSRKVFKNQTSSRGFLIPLAAIIIVGLSVLGIAIARLASQSSETSVVEGISMQAFYAAESGAYAGMTTIMFDQTDRAIVDGNCSALSTTINFTAVGLQSCSATITCSVANVAGNPESFYTIRSEAQCGGGDLTAERIIEVSSYM